MPEMTQQSHAVNLLPQTAMQTSHQMAMAALDTVVEYLIEPYQKTFEKVKQGQDPSTLVIETSYHIHEKIERRICKAREHMKNHSDNIEKRFNRLEEMLKEMMTVIGTRTYAQATATPAPEINCVREIQQQNLDHKVEERRKQNKLEIILILQGADPNTEDQLT